MTFMTVNAVFLLVALAIAVVAHRHTGARPGWRPYAVAVAVLFALTTVFDNLMIAAGLFDYGTEHRLGVLIGKAPIEDYAYPLGAVILLPALWVLLRRDDR